MTYKVDAEKAIESERQVRRELQRSNLQNEALLKRVAASRWARNSKEGPVKLYSQAGKVSTEVNEESYGDDIDAASREEFAP